MGDQEQKSETKRDSSSHDEKEAQANPKVVESGKKLKEDIDQLVEDIDEVLEENAAEFVKNYVQKGGQ